MVGMLVSSHVESRAMYNLTQPIPLLVEHVAVEFIVEPFPPSGSFFLFSFFFLLNRYPPGDAVLTPAILPITGRLMVGGSVLFLPVKVQRTCPLLTSCLATTEKRRKKKKNRDDDRENRRKHHSSMTSCQATAGK